MITWKVKINGNLPTLIRRIYTRAFKIELTGAFQSHLAGKK
jgi:hypothetical protein